MNELAVALSFKPEMIMLDNWSNKDIKRGMSLVKKIAPRTMVEVSGGITVRRVEELKRVGVKLISCGALTTQETNVDISMRVEVGRGKKR